MSALLLPDIIQEVESLKDGLGHPIDEGIKPAVVALRYCGFNTIASCEGHLETGFPYPWVDIQYNDDELRRDEKVRLKKYLKEFYKIYQSKHPIIMQNFADYRLQNVKWPNSMRKRKEHWKKSGNQTELNEYRQEMHDFAEFLLTRQR